MNTINSSDYIINDALVKDIKDIIAELESGTVLVTVKNRRIMQIEVSEKKCFDDIWQIEGGAGI